MNSFYQRLRSLRSAHRFASWLPLVCGTVLLTAPGISRAIPVEQYLKMRRQQNYDPRLHFLQVETNPSAYRNRVIEVRGTVTGVIRRDDKMSFMLELADKKEKSLLLTAPPAENELLGTTSQPTLRVLARVAESNTGNVVPLEVLAVTYDGEVTQREKEAALRGNAPHSSSASTETGSERRGSSPSRGVYARAMNRNTASFGVSDFARKVFANRPEILDILPAYKKYILRCNPRLNDQELDTIAVAILGYAVEFNVEPRLVVALIIAESDFDPKCTSNKGAMGLGQLMPDELNTYGLNNAYDPLQNIKGSIKQLRVKLDLYREPGVPQNQMQMSERQMMLALAAYNAGTGAVKKFGGIPPYKETQNYVKKIMRIFRELTASASR